VEVFALGSIAHNAFIHVMHFLLSKAAHQANILVKTFPIVIEKCWLSYLVGNVQYNDSNTARFAGSFCK